MKTLHSSSSSSLTITIKFKTLIQNFLFSHLFRITRILTKAKSILIEFLKEIHLKNVHVFIPLIFKKNKNKNKLYLGSFRFHYNWSSSHLGPKSLPRIHNEFNGYVYYGSTLNSFVDEMTLESQLSGYLDWLEEKDNGSDHEINEINEIDALADKFITNCHERFKLEKEESYRRFQEMMARSL